MTFETAPVASSFTAHESADAEPLGTGPTYDVVWPRSPRGVQAQRRAARLPSLDGKRIAFLWDYVFRGDELFPILEKELLNRYSAIEIVGYAEFGNLHGADEKARVERLPDDLRDRGVDAVVSGMGC